MHERGHQEVPPAITDCAFDITLVIALARTAEPVLKEIVRLQLRESSGALPGSVPEDPRHRDRGVVVAVLHQSPDKRGVPLPVKMVSQLTQTWHSQVRSFC